MVKRVLFVCHGNICRSPMAEYVMKALVRTQGLADCYEIDSAAVSREEIGNPVYPPAARTLKQHAVPCGNHRARQMTAEDYRHFDLIIGMDAWNLRLMQRISGGDPQDKCSLLLGWAGRGGDVDDPWYTGDFETAYRDIEEGCRALLQKTRP